MKKTRRQAREDNKFAEECAEGAPEPRPLHLQILSDFKVDKKEAK